MIDKELLEILVCPETGKPLEEAGREIVALLNGLVEFGTPVDRSGEREVFFAAAGNIFTPSPPPLLSKNIPANW